MHPCNILKNNFKKTAVQQHVQITELIKHGKAVKSVCAQVPMTGLKGGATQVLMRQESGSIVGPGFAPAVSDAIDRFAFSIDGIGTKDYKGKENPHLTHLTDGQRACSLAENRHFGAIAKLHTHLPNS